ncbi:MAG: hypothetical protein QF351_04870, partial [Phycisphaerales bacterium]|nr:hypothetical protein [Phycisphaerales bacterium]
SSGSKLPLNDDCRRGFIAEHGGFLKAHEFACDHVTKAIHALDIFEDQPARDRLIQFANQSVLRKA